MREGNKRSFAIIFVLFLTLFIINVAVVEAACVEMRPYTGNPGDFDSDSRKKEGGCRSECNCYNDYPFSGGGYAPEGSFQTSTNYKGTCYETEGTNEQDDDRCSGANVQECYVVARGAGSNDYITFTAPIGCDSGKACYAGRCLSLFPYGSICSGDYNCQSGCCEDTPIPCPGNTVCFLAGTKISMADGSKKNIEDVAVGDSVASYNPETGAKEYGNVKALLRHKPEEMKYDYYLIINNNVKVTPEHRFFTDKGLVEANYLEIGSKMINEDSGTTEITNIEKVWERVPTYNFEVEGLHTYYAEGLAVHNRKIDDPGEIFFPIRSSTCTMPMCKKGRGDTCTDDAECGCGYTSCTYTTQTTKTCQSYQSCKDQQNPDSYCESQDANYPNCEWANIGGVNKWGCVACDSNDDCAQGSPSTGSGACKKCNTNTGTCVNADYNTDPNTDCELGAYQCSADHCERLRQLGTCDGSGACRMGTPDNAPEGTVCRDSDAQFVDPNPTDNCDYYENCDAGDCTAIEAFRACNGAGNCKTNNDFAYINNIQAEPGYTLRNNCQTDGATPCNGASKCTTGRGNNLYPGTGGSQSCEGYCDANANCDFAASCAACGAESCTDTGNDFLTLNSITESDSCVTATGTCVTTTRNDYCSGTTTAFDRTCSGVNEGTPLSADCNTYDGWYNAGSGSCTGICSASQNQRFRDYSCSGNYCQFTLGGSRTVPGNCTAGTSCSGASTSCSATPCNAVWRCSAAPGDNNYNTGGDYRCQASCDGSLGCDYASNCENCNDRETGAQCWSTVNPANTLNIVCNDWSCSIALSPDACADTGADRVNNTYICDASMDCQTITYRATSYICHMNNTGAWQWTTPITLPAETRCGDDYDNNCNGQIDECSERTYEKCINIIDDDIDGAADFPADTECRGTMNGTIFEADNPSVIVEGVTVKGVPAGLNAKFQSISTSSDFQGRYSIGQALVGTYTFVASKKDYIDEIKTVTILSGQNTAVNFNLKKGKNCHTDCTDSNGICSPACQGFSQSGETCVLVKACEYRPKGYIALITDGTNTTEYTCCEGPSKTYSTMSPKITGNIETLYDYVFPAKINGITPVKVHILYWEPK